MEKPEEEVSISRISESKVTLNDNVAGETLEESVECARQGLIEGSFSEELVGEDAGGCSGKDIMVEVLGSDVYIDGVCTRGSEAGLNDEVASGGSVEDDKDVKPSGGTLGVGNEAEAGFEGSQAVQFSETKSENATAQLDGTAVEREEVLIGTLKDHNVERGGAFVGADEIDVANIKGAPVLDNGAKKEVATGVSGSLTVIESTPEETNVPAVEDTGVPDAKLTNTKFDNALGGLTAVSSLRGENVHKESVERDNQQQKNLADHGATEGGNDVTMKSLDEQKKVDNKEGDKISEKETFAFHKVESLETNATNEKLHSIGEQPTKIDEVGENSNSLLKEVVAGAEVAVDKNLLNSEVEKCFRLEMCIEKNTSQVSSDTGQGMEVDEHLQAEGFALVDGEQNSENYETVGASTNRDAQVCNTGEISLTDRGGTVNFNNEVPGCALSEQPQNSEQCLEKDIGGDLALVESGSRNKMELNENVSYAEHVTLHKGNEAEVEDESAKIKIVSHTAYVQGTSLSFGVGDKSLEVNTICRSVEDNQTADGGILAPVVAEEEKSNDEVPLSADDHKSNFLNSVNQSVTSGAALVESNVRQTIEGQGSISEWVGSHEGQETEVEEFYNADQRKTTDEKVIKHTAMKPGSSGRCYQGNYQPPPEKEGEFSVSDMVWGKVRSHPWWPGQIFDLSDSSEKAMKHYKKDCFLVAYFGDRTFAWNEASQLKPFRAHFSNIEKQSNSESFHNAVDCALDEVSRRVEFGLACSCIPKDTYDEIKFQNVENTGIQEELSFSHRVDESLSVSSFSPNKLINYLKILSQCPTDGFDRLELVIAKAQLLAFYRLQGYSSLPELQHSGGLDNEMDSLTRDPDTNLREVIQHATSVGKNADQASSGHGVLKSRNSSYHKRKHNLKDGMYPKKKERSLSELIGGTPESPDGDYWSDEKAIDSLVSPTHSKKRKTADPYADDSGMQDGRKTISLAKVSSTTKQSFKIGECIRRVASQLTGSPSTLKSSGDKSQKPDGSIDVFSEDVSDVSLQNLEEAHRSSSTVPTECSSLDDLLSLFQWAAQDPFGNCNFLSVIVSFFSDFRNSIIVGNYPGREITPADKVRTKRKKMPIGGSPETFEFEDMSDTYWTDRVIQNGSEEQPSKRSRKRDNQPVPADSEKPVQVSRRTYSRKKYSDSNHAEAPEKPSGYIDERSPAELVMNFAELDSVPSESSLNKMFKRFGPLKESETEVDRVSSRARVVFKKCADAEIAFNSAKKFNIFGAILVNYQLNYTPSALFKASSLATTQDQEMHLDLSNFEVNMV